jgi:AraC-like DNA-binding protein
MLENFQAPVIKAVMKNTPAQAMAMIGAVWFMIASTGFLLIKWQGDIQLNYPAIVTMMNNQELYETAIPNAQYCFRPSVFLWPNRSLFLGPLQQLAFHAMGSVTINIGLYQPFFMKMPGGVYRPYRCAIIPAGCRHELNAFGHVMASLNIEKNSTEFMHFRRCFPFDITTITPLDDVNWIKCFQRIYEDKPAKADITQWLNQLLYTDGTAHLALDSRIDSIMKSIQLDPGNAISQTHLAASVGLSTSRFRHLFLEQTDMPFRRYRIWRRVMLAMNSLHKRDHLTSAALDAGFTDSAHFNRCFRDIFGINPSLVFRHIDRFEV